MKRSEALPFGFLKKKGRCLWPSAHIVAEKVRQRVQQETLASLAPQLTLTVSRGVACADELSPLERTSEQLMALADRRLYRAKDLGRNCIVFV